MPCTNVASPDILYEDLGGLLSLLKKKGGARPFLFSFIRKEALHFWEGDSRWGPDASPREEIMEKEIVTTPGDAPGDRLALFCVTPGAGVGLYGQMWKEGNAL